MIRVLHITTDLKVGGAQMMLLKLIENADRDRFKHIVISLMDLGVIGKKLQARGVEVLALESFAGYLGWQVARRLISQVRKIKPDVIQGWMYHGNLAAWLASRFANSKPQLIWGIRQSLGSFGDEKWMTRMVIRANIWLSHQPDAIVFNAKRSHEQHVNAGMFNDSCAVIPNGFDTQLFKLSPMARTIIRQELGLHEDAILIGLIGRFHPMKDHKGFLNAASEVLRRNGDAHFLLAGDGVSNNNNELQGWIEALDLSRHVHLLGRREDAPLLTASLDIAVSASARNEGFANVIGEAMSCSVPCVVTDVGDSAHIVSTTGRVVPPGNPQRLADAICEMLEMDNTERMRLGERGRDRVISEFSIENVARQFEMLYTSKAK